MFGFKKTKTPAKADTLEDRIRAACPPPHTSSILIALELDADHSKRALVIPHAHGMVAVLIEPDPKTYVAECFVVVGDELHDDPHGFSIWPGHDEHFMTQFKGEPRATVLFFGEVQS